ncbi:DUF4258 domain-containing protein [Haliangium ochraceum]|uniref:DUF4258 domain-containing protein n=1 Tax=Haliangium ochraceum (strain DSM 14365 / JCM 11303 / SMP-2) TaxID=502025 RepID=D0LGV1_HALO1|nr:DUF4258 domain-containing protein [Haliangium ochraceum]ACY14673.1 hypothetical protein Hoch_2128 [Haliangium ochraceum DSM 14365]
MTALGYSEEVLPPFSTHALRRMSQRGIRRSQVMSAFLFGRAHHLRGARIYVIGRREVREAAEQDGFYLDDLEGLHVVCHPDGLVLTVYRDRRLNVREGYARGRRRSPVPRGPRRHMRGTSQRRRRRCP